MIARVNSALVALYSEHYRRLVLFLGRFTRRDDVIEEVVKDTVLIVWQKAFEFRGQVRVSTRLMSIAYRVTLKVLRQGGLPYEQLHAESDERTSEPFANHALVDCLSEDLTRLSAEQRLVLERAYVMECSLEEITKITAAPMSTVKAWKFHAHVKLRNVMPGLSGALLRTIHDPYLSR